MKEETFDELASQLEEQISKSEKTEEAPVQEEKSEQGLLKALMTTAKDYLGKAQTSDLKAEKDRRGSLTESSDDPAKTPKKSGAGYEDSSKYEARKGHGKDDDEDEDDDVPAFMKKKAKKKAMKKSIETEDEESEDSEEVIDVTETVEELQKSVARLEEGVAVFGDLLAEVADPRRDKAMATVMKSLSHIIEKQNKLEKSLGEVQPLMKALAQMPGAPKMVGVQANLKKSVETTEGAETQTVLSKEDKDRLMKAAIEGKISTNEMKKAIATNDASLLEKIK